MNVKHRPMVLKPERDRSDLKTRSECEHCQTPPSKSCTTRPSPRFECCSSGKKRKKNMEAFVGQIVPQNATREATQKTGLIFPDNTTQRQTHQLARVSHSKTRGANRVSDFHHLINHNRNQLKKR